MKNEDLYHEAEMALLEYYYEDPDALLSELA